MAFLASSITICFIACHGGPADHFATFAESLSGKVESVDIYASGPAIKKFQERGIAVHYPFFIDGLCSEEEDVLADQIAQTCSAASLVITDVGHTFDLKIHQAFARRIVHVPHLTYYDNPESYVPGGYSKVAAEVMLAADAVLFANSHLAKTAIFKEEGKEIAFGNCEKIGIGYYPTHQADLIFRRRSEEKYAMRQTFFLKNNLVDTKQKIFVYFGSNNQEFFSKAFPSFLALLEEGVQQTDCSNLLIVLQQHPGAKAKNLDVAMLSEWIDQRPDLDRCPKFIVSDLSIEDAQIIADGVLYYQTSIAPQLALAGIPIAQIGHEAVEDLLVRNKLIPFVTNFREWMDVVDGSAYQKLPPSPEVIVQELGCKENWLSILEQTIYFAIRF